MSERSDLEARYLALKGANLALDLTRGKPAADQLDLSNALDGILAGDFRAEDGTDVRNYGNLRGLPEARALGAHLLDVDPDEVMAGGNASLPRRLPGDPLPAGAARLIRSARPSPRPLPRSRATVPGRRSERSIAPRRTTTESRIDSRRGQWKRLLPIQTFTTPCCTCRS